MDAFKRAHDHIFREVVYESEGEGEDEADEKVGKVLTNFVRSIYISNYLILCWQNLALQSWTDTCF